MSKAFEAALSRIPADPTVLAALGRIFADAFARYTVEVLSLWEAGGHSLDELLDPHSALCKQLGEFDAPQWVKQAYEQARTGQTEVIDDRMLGTRLARNNIIIAMNRRGVSQTELARRLKMSPASISRILKEPERSRVATIRKIARALEIDLSEILA